MSGYGFGKRPATPATPIDDTHLDLSGIVRKPLSVDPAREAAAIARGDALGYVDRGDQTPERGALFGVGEGPEPGVRRRRQAAPQGSLYIKGPKETLDWFIEYTNQRGHRSYWQTIAELREMVEGKDQETENER